MGIRNWRVLRPFSGMIHDLQLRAPWYGSDWVGKEDIWRDSETLYKILSGTIRIFFVNLLPALAYALDMYYRTDHIWGTNEVLLASAIPAVLFAVFSCQPLTIVGVTGLIDLFGYTTYNIVTVRYGVDFLGFMAWVGIWAAIMHWLISIFNWCDYMKYVTDFSSTAFGMYVGIVYIIKGVELIIEEFGEGLSEANGYLSCLIALLFFALTWMTTRIGMGNYLHRYIRGFCTDFSLVIWTIFFAGFAHIPGHLRDVDVRKYPVSQAFQPTPPIDPASRAHGWFIHFWEIPVRWWFIAIPFAALVTALFYYDHNVSSLMAQARHYPLRKHAGFHWDFFLLGITTLVAGFIGIPYPNGLVPQAPVHTDSCAIMRWPRLDDDHDGSEQTISSSENREEKKKGPYIVRILEQRWTHFGMGLLLFGMLTRPLLVALSTVPRAVFAGVFITVGWASIESNPITLRTVNLLRDPIATPTRRKRATVLFLSLQWLTIAAEVAISQTIAAIGFPVIILLLIPLRWTWMLRWFSYEELAELDTPTAEADVVLDSFGGAPAIQSRTKPRSNADPEKSSATANATDATPSDARRRKLKQAEQDNPFTMG
ncbi:HCO3-transporter family protein [Taphrina deformans PYCC 5710]|uniref:HCO3-transporter family protein n=1 Tax=Taphrina deformans (strain PYCC 5710 / ATCC 11124 / CBS 356.35 / IMI 108563 / JCM 9778 / NBRC 8474) TaxID=1097556 RepID=R4X9T0_TAPDE|nr:HCO3-transporter family protein [Taphrina deformans PYCC 5710]|eukprot:CCG80994.1 HCO3-transporter family protein [Taphrina deformans PYCC 5710]